MPQHKLEEAYRMGAFESAYSVSTPPSDLVYTGPFRLKEYRPGEKCVLERNPYYWRFDNQGQRLPYLDQLIFVILPDHNTRILQFESGDVDMIDDIPADGYNLIAAGAADKNYTVYDLGPGLGTEFIWFNLRTDKDIQGDGYVAPHKQEWFNNVNFRRALNHAIDRQSIINTVLYGRGVEHWGTGATAANKKWHNPNVAKYPFDLKKASRMLDSEGFIDRNLDQVREDPQGHPVEIVVLTNSGNNRRTQIGNLIREDWAKIGIKATFLELDPQALGLRDHYEARFYGFGGGGLDPAAGMNVWKSSGTHHCWWPEQAKPATRWEARVDSLMDAQIQELDEMKRKALYDEVQAIIAEMSPLLMCPVRNVSVAVRNHLGNVSPVILEHRLLWNVDEHYIRSPEEMAMKAPR
jgi:peptide/nickel transport system substrate-binding protein